jgi:hypothetical protein
MTQSGYLAHDTLRHALFGQTHAYTFPCYLYAREHAHTGQPPRTSWPVAE